MKRFIVFVGTVIVSLSVMATSLTDGLVGYWPFDGDAKDYSGNDNHGTIYGVTAVADRYGNSASSYKFGTGKYISVAASSQVDAILDFTLAFWVKITSYDGRPEKWVALISKGSSSRQFGVQFAIGTNGTPFFEINAYEKHDFAGFDFDKWMHVAVTRNGKEGNLYINGRKVSSVSLSSSPTINSGNLEIGRDAPGSMEYLQGLMDEVCLYNRSLSELEVLAIYNDGLKICTVTFDANGGEGSMAALKVLNGTTQTLPANKFKLQGSVFQGWKDANGKLYEQESEILVDSDMTLYAVWDNPPLTLTAESANWSNGSITLKCEDSDTSGAEHMYSLEYKENDLWVPVNDVAATNISVSADGFAHLTDTTFWSRLGGIPPVEYRVKDENGRVSAGCVTRNRYLLSVGYSAYGNGNKPIRVMHDNARDFRLECIEQRCFNADDTQFIYNDNARLHDIRESITNFSERVQSGDIFVFYIDTHGGDYGFRVGSNENTQQSELEVVVASLATYDADYTSDALLSDVRLFPPEVAVIGVISACNSRSLIGGVDSWDEINNWLDHLGFSQCLGNVAWITSCDSGQSSYVRPFDTFGKAFIYDGFRNGYADMPLSGTEYKGGNSDAVVTLGELARYAKEFSQGRSDSEPSVVQIENEPLLNRIAMGRRQGVVIPQPSSPENVIASHGRYETKVYVTWNSAQNATSYRVYRFLSGQENHKEWIALSDYLYAMDTNCALAQHYEYQVQAVGPGGKSALSALTEKCIGWSGTEPYFDFLDRNRPLSASTASYETLEKFIAPNGYSYGESYIAGLDPTNETSKFTASITMSNGVPSIVWSPDLGSNRTYTIYGKENLTDEEWIAPTNSAHKFFKVEVEMP